MTLNLNKIAAEPTLVDLFELREKNLMIAFNCHAIATIQSFDSDDQTVTATMAYKKTIFKLNKTTNVYDPVLVDYPLIVDCPAVVLGGGSTSLTFPIAKGDECLILFNDRDIDNWFQGGPPIGVASSRLHSFSDGIALVGLRNSSRSLTGYDMLRAVLQNGTTRVGVSADKVIIENDIDTLFNLLNDLITAVKNISVTVPALGLISGLPAAPVTGQATGTISPGSQSALSSAATALGDLLE